jgi:glycosyltransferase involved in cell wall biosynthesis
MITVLHLTSSFGLGGGAEINLSRLVCRMDRSRFRNVVVTMTEGVGYSSLQAALVRANVPVYSLGMRRGVPNPLGATRLLRIIRQTRPLILQTWMYHADLLGLLVGYPARVPLIAWNIQCSALPMAHHGWMTDSVRRVLATLSSLPDIVLANSQSGLRFHRHLGYRPRRWLYMPNGLDVNEFSPDSKAFGWLRSELGLAPNTPLIGLIARFHPVKDPSTFVEAARLLATEDPRVHFVLVGRDMAAANVALRRLVDSTGAAERFHLLGHRTDVNRIAAGLDISCSSSVSEGSANVIAESMACGTPCVVTDVGDSAFLLQDTGKIVPARHPAALARSCRELLDMSPERRCQLGLAARRRVEESFSLGAIVVRYENLYEELLGTARAA